MFKGYGYANDEIVKTLSGKNLNKENILKASICEKVNNIDIDINLKRWYSERNKMSKEY